MPCDTDGHCGQGCVDCAASRLVCSGDGTTCELTSDCVGREDLTRCDDEDPCTTQDECQTAVCVPGSVDKDTDTDGFVDAVCPGGADCNDANENIHPNQLEGPSADITCSDTEDNDCNGRSDDADPGCSSETHLYRSVGVDGSNLNPAGRTVGIAGRVARFSDDLPLNVGVGDILVYSAGGPQVATIYARASATIYQVRSLLGNDAAPASPGTAVAVHRAYTSLKNWHDQSQNSNIGPNINPSTDLVASRTIMNAVCYADGEDGDSVDINGWVTGPENHLRIFTPVSAFDVGQSQRHPGKWDATKYYLTHDPATQRWDGVIEIYGGHVRLEGLQIWTTQGLDEANVDVIGVGVTSAAELHLSHCIIRGPGGSTGEGLNETDTGVQLDEINSDLDVRIWNNIIHGFASGICWSYGGYVLNGAIYGNTLVGNTQYGIVLRTGVATRNNIHLKGNLSVNPLASGQDYYLENMEDTEANVSRDSSSPEVTHRGRSVSFVDDVNAPYDFRLAPADSGARGFGLDFDGDSLWPFADDVEGQIRIAPWDAGADDLP
ncbi:hypothetical protein ACFL6C_05115 [Myxococcota bacterium]